MEPCVIRLMRPYILFDVVCKKCNSFDVKPTSTEIVFSCKKCQTRNYSIANVDLYHSYIPEVVDALKFKNEVIIVGEKGDNDYKTADISRHSKMEDDIWNCLLRMKDTFSRMPYVVSNIDECKMKDNYTNCLDCGVCCNCRTCKCGKVYVGNYCPDCKGKRYDRTFIKNISKSNKCPHCSSINIKFTRIDSKHSSCPSCESKLIKKVRIKEWYKLSIKRNVRDELNG